MGLTVRLLGNPEIIVDQQPLSFRTRKELALLIYVLVEGGMHSRQVLMALLWPDSPSKNATVTLRGALSRLRKALGPAGKFILSQAGQVGFDFEAPVELDTGWLSTAVLPETPAEALTPILEIDRGEFLTGFSLPDAPGFDTWAAIQREATQRQVEAVYDLLTQHQLDQQDSAAAVETAALWVRRAPLSEAAYRRLMVAQALTGDRPAALKTYAECRAMLQGEFGLQPDRATAALAESIGQDRLPEEPRNGRASPESLAAATLLSSRRATQLPFEGRAEEHSQLVMAYRQASQGSAQCFALIGATGVGKTRLLDSFRAWVVLDSPGLELWEGRAYEMGGRLPYQPVIEALRQRLEQVNAPEDLLEDVWLAELSQLMPELRARYPDLPSPMTGDAHFVRARLFSAIATLGSALAARQPAVFILDDMQWAEAETWDLIQYLARRWSESGTTVLLLLGVRQENYAAEAALRERLAQLGREVPLTRLLLDTLNGTAVGQLVTQLAVPEADDEATQAFAAWLWAETNGLPFYIEALLQMLVEEGVLEVTVTAGRPGYDFATALSQVRSAVQVQVPQGVREALITRLDRLSEKEADILLAAAVLGRASSFERLCQVAAIREEEALRAVELLLKSRLLAEDQTARQPYTLAHDYIRTVVYSESHAARRRVFHRRALIALEAERAPAAECAYHALASMLDEPAFRYSLAAGDEALASWAFADSLAHYDRAREIARRMEQAAVDIEPGSWLRLYKNRGHALELVGDYPAAQANYQEMHTLAEERNDQSLELAYLIAKCVIHASHTPVFNPPIARESGQAALHLARILNDREAETSALAGLMFAALYGGEDNQITLSYGEASLSLARELGLQEQMGSVLVHLCWPYIAQKQLGAALEANHAAEAVWRELGNLPKLVETYEMRQFLYHIANEPEEQFAASSELQRLSLATDNRLSQANALAMMGNAHLLKGRLAEAFTLMRKATAIISGSPVYEQSECYFWMDLYLAAGDLSQAEYWADRLYAQQDRLMPMFQSEFLNRIARVKIACGKLGEGKAILDRAVELCSPDNVWSHFVGWIAMTEAYLHLAMGRPERAFTHLEERVQSYRQAGFLIYLAEEQWLRGRVLLALGEVEAAREFLLEAKTLAEAKGERLYLWRILATLGDLETRRGNEAEAEKWGEQAVEIITYITGQFGEEVDLRAAFLSQPEVGRVLAFSEKKIANRL